MLARVGISLGLLALPLFTKFARNSEAIAMSEPSFQQFDEPPESEPLKGMESMAQMEFEEWLEVLHKSDRSFYNLMAMEVWSIAKTMDGLLPGFWTRFMSHRQIALKQFLQHKHAHPGAHPGTDSPPPTSEV